MDPVSRGGAQNRAHNVDPDLVPQPGVKKQKNRNDSINLLVPCISSTEQLAGPSCGATEGEQGHEASQFFGLKMALFLVRNFELGASSLLPAHLPLEHLLDMLATTCV